MSISHQHKPNIHYQMQYSQPSSYPQRHAAENRIGFIRHSKWNRGPFQDLWVAKETSRCIFRKMLLCRLGHDEDFDRKLRSKTLDG